MRALGFLLLLLGLAPLTLGRFASPISLDLDFPPINTSNLPNQEFGRSLTALASLEAPKLSTPNTVQVAGGWDPNDLATASEWVRFLQRGKWMGCLLLATDEEAGKRGQIRWTDHRSLPAVLGMVPFRVSNPALRNFSPSERLIVVKASWQNGVGMRPLTNKRPVSSPMTLRNQARTALGPRCKLLA
jgi:hypothetical protein